MKKRIKVQIILSTFLMLIMLNSFVMRDHNLISKCESKRNPISSGFCDLLGNYYDGGEALDVAVSGSIVYVADGSNGLEIIATQDPTNPHELSQIFSYANRVCVLNETAYVLTNVGLSIVNVSDPTNPATLGSASGIGTNFDLAIGGDFAYIVGLPPHLIGETRPLACFQVINITDPLNPSIITTLTTSPPYSHNYAISIEDDLAYIAGDDLLIYNISDPFNPQVLGVHPRGDGSSIFVRNNIAYYGSFDGCLSLINVTDPTNPSLIIEYKLNEIWPICDIKLIGDLAFLAASVNGTLVLDISDPQNIRFIGQHIEADSGGYSFQNYAIEVVNGIGYAANYENGLSIIDFDVSVPEVPYNLQFIPKFYSINLTWETPASYGADILQYNIYRSDILGGPKSYIGSSINNDYLDDGLDINRYYYYTIKAENILGEGDPSEELQAFAGPYIKWNAPEEGERVILPVGDAVFNFSYSYDYLDEVKLFLNGIDYADVKDLNSTILTPYTINIDGSVSAELRGYITGNVNPITSDQRNFIFAKLKTDATEIVEEDKQYIGSKLYSILHDPNGDKSYSSYKEATKLSLGVGFSIAVGVSTSLKVAPPKFSLFGLDFGFSQKLTYSLTTELGFDFRYEITDTTELSSSRESNNPDYIGPGYGDIYWGEAWTLKWELVAKHREYFNGTESFEEPTLYYGIIRGGEVLLNDYNAPQEWRDMNPVHNGWQNVVWGNDGAPFTVVGGQPITDKTQVTSSLKTSLTITIGFKSETCAKISGFGASLENTLTFDLQTKFYAELGVSTSYEVGRTIWDDDPTDTITQMWGIDQTFGTYIFKTEEFMCETSYPLEHGTYDYIPPIIGFPHIQLDSNQDGVAPCKDDSPIITVDLFDEGGIAMAYIYFSFNDGLNWDSALLSEQVANSGTWQGIIPAYNHGYTVLWYLKAWDFRGRFSNRTDPNGNYYRYTIINRAPLVDIITPIGGETYQDTVSIEWSGLDPDNDVLTYSLAYNLDNTGWHLITNGLTGTSYQWNVSQISSENVLLKVIVNDGNKKSEDVMDFVFSIKKPPHAPNLIPASDINYLLGSLGNQIRWRIDDEDLSFFKVFKDGVMLYSMDFELLPSTLDEFYEIVVNVDGLGLGSSIYKIEVYDKSGHIVTDEVLITVYDNPKISRNVSSSLISWNITDDDIKLCEYKLYRDGSEIKTGTWDSGVPVEFSYSGLDPGDYEFLIYATDGTGGIAADLVFITVKESAIFQPIPFLVIGIIIGVSLTGITFLITFLKFKLRSRKKI